MHNERLTEAIYIDEGNIPEQYSLVSVTPHHLGTTYRVFDKLNACYSRIVSFKIDLISEEKIKYYLNEFHKIIQITHPNLLPIMGVDRHGNRMMFTLGEFNCATFNKFIEDSRLNFEETLEVSVQIASVLEELHSHKIYHCALEPQYVFIDPEFKITVSPPLLDRLQIELHKASYRKKSVTGAIKQQNDDESEGQSLRNLDIASLGSLLCFASTGYPPKRLPGTDWEVYGLAPQLHEIVHRCLSTSGFKNFSTITEVCELLESLQTEYVSSYTLSKASRDSRFFRKNALARWTPLIKTDAELNKLKQDSSSNSITVLMDGKFELKKSIRSDATTTTFNALDHSNDKKDIILHVFQHSADVTWQSQFKSMAKKLTKLEHHNLCPVSDAKLIDKMGYITRNREYGETLTSFLTRRTLTFEEITYFARQIISGIAACDGIGIDHYRLSQNTIVVYKTSDDKYLYRFTGVERSALESIKPEPLSIINSISNMEMLAPEMYENNLHGFKTIQYQIAQLLILLINGKHPCDGLTAEECEIYHTSTSSDDVLDTKMDYPEQFATWLSRCCSPMIERRFNNPSAMYHGLEKILSQDA